MESLKINPKILAIVFLSVVVIADLIPAPNLGPGLIVSSFNWASSQIQSQTEAAKSGLSLRARRLPNFFNQ